jgi:hypothetical protein
MIPPIEIIVTWRDLRLRLSAGASTPVDIIVLRDQAAGAAGFDARAAAAAAAVPAAAAAAAVPAAAGCASVRDHGQAATAIAARAGTARADLVAGMDMSPTGWLRRPSASITHDASGIAASKCNRIEPDIGRRRSSPWPKRPGESLGGFRGGVS